MWLSVTKMCWGAKEHVFNKAVNNKRLKKRIEGFGRLCCHDSVFDYYRCVPNNRFHYNTVCSHVVSASKTLLESVGVALFGECLEYTECMDLQLSSGWCCLHGLRSFCGHCWLVCVFTCTNICCTVMFGVSCFTWLNQTRCDSDMFRPWRWRSNNCCVCWWISPILHLSISSSLPASVPLSDSVLSQSHPSHLYSSPCSPSLISSFLPSVALSFSVSLGITCQLFSLSVSLCLPSLHYSS